MRNTKRSRIGLAAALGAVAGLGALPTVASGDLSDASLTVTTRGDASGGPPGPVSTSDVLTSGVTYRIVVAGTFSPWGRDLWARYPKVWVACGFPEVGPMFPTANVPNGATGNDAAFRYATVARGGCGALKLPTPTGIQISAGGAFVRPSFDGQPSVPTTDHVYRFSVVGAGEPLRVRTLDRYAADNYGDLRLAISSEVDPAVPGQSGRPGASAPPGVGGATGPAPTGVLGASGSRIPTTGACISRRTLTVHLRSKNIRQRTLTARLSGKGVRNRKLVVRSGARLVRIPVSLRGLRKARYRVTIRFVRKTGVKQTVVRRFRACALAPR